MTLLRPFPLATVSGFMFYSMIAFESSWISLGNYIPEGSRGYYVVGLDAAAAAAAAASATASAAAASADLVVLALARTGIN